MMTCLAFCNLLEDFIIIATTKWKDPLTISYISIPKLHQSTERL